MSKTLETFHESGLSSQYIYSSIPDFCPICHWGIDVRFIYAFSEQPGDYNSQVVFQCPRIDCRSLFIGYYKKRGSKIYFYYLDRIAPWKLKKRDFGDAILNISPIFIEIYNEASEAEQYELKQICGVGYRKALEFLIKDYAIYLNPDKEEEIKEEWLSKVIKKFIDNPNIKLTAEKATWLGNDEIHYVRKWEDMDIEDLKTLIELTIRWIEMEEMTKGYSEKMKPGE